MSYAKVGPHCGRGWSLGIVPITVLVFLGGCAGGGSGAGANAAPKLSITSVKVPDGREVSPGAVVTSGTVLTFTASSTDAESGDLASAIAWLIDGSPTGTTGHTLVLATGNLVAGAHVVTSTVVDPRGASAMDSFVFTIEACPEAVHGGVTTSTMSGASGVVVVYQGCPPLSGSTPFSGTEYSGADAASTLFDLSSSFSSVTLPDKPAVTVHGNVSGTLDVVPGRATQNVVIGPVSLQPGAHLILTFTGDGFVNVRVNGPVTSLGSNTSLEVAASSQVVVAQPLLPPTIEATTTVFFKTTLNGNADLEVVVNGVIAP